MKKAIFLDRDGTINIEKNYLYRIEDFEYVEGAVGGLRELQDLGYILVVITNQSGIARGYYTEEEYMTLMDWMKRDLEDKGIYITKSYFCPHYPGGIVKKYAVECDCRKPGTQLFHLAQKELDIDFSKSFAIGDKLRDLTICNETKVRGILLSTKEKVDDCERVHCCRNWQEIALEVTKWNEM